MSTSTEKRVWSQKEKKYLIDYFPVYSLAELARHFKVGEAPIRQLAIELQLIPDLPKPLMGLREWTSQEDQYLRDYKGLKTYNQLASELGRTEIAIRCRFVTLKLSRPANVWTENEVQYLIDHYKKLPTQAIAQHLTRTVGSVVKRAQMLGISLSIQEQRDINRAGRDKPNVFIKPRKWTPEDDLYLIENWATKSTSELVSIINRTRGSIRSRVSILGISKSLDQIHRQKSFAFSPEEDAYILAHKNEQSVSELGKFLFRKPNQILRRAAILGIQLIQETNRKAKTQHWTPKDDQYLIDQPPAESYKQIGLHLGRSVQAIAKRLAKLKKANPGCLVPLVPPVDRKITKEELDFMKTNWSHKTVREIAKELSRSQSIIRKYGTKLGLKKSPDDIQKLITSGALLSDYHVASMISRANPDLKEYIMEVPQLLQLKRKQVILNRKLKAL